METNKDECEHDWNFVDDSFSHEYGTEQIHYWQCSKCDKTKDIEPGDYIIDDFDIL